MRVRLDQRVREMFEVRLECLLELRIGIARSELRQPDGGAAKIEALEAASARNAPFVRARVAADSLRLVHDAPVPAQIAGVLGLRQASVAEDPDRIAAGKHRSRST